MDVATVRAEIKAWERDWKAEHGTEPTVQDIKDRPNISEKYKLYKKLSKAKAEPPKSAVVQSRAVRKTEPPTLTNNPFSPVKSGPKPPSSRNPFATPSKSRPRDESPDPFPLIQPFQIASSSQINAPQPPNSAVSRARKRLRGEPVSPSPVKVKRQRVLQLAQGSSDEEDDEHVNSSFVMDSPVKASAGSKSFMSLFNENTDDTRPLKRTLTRTSTAGVGLFDRAPRRVLADADADAGLKKKAPKPSLSKGFISGKDNLHSVVQKDPTTDTEMEPIAAPGPVLVPPSPPPVTNNRYRNDIKGMGKANNKKKAKQPVEEDEDSSEDGNITNVKMANARRGIDANKVHEVWEDRMAIGGQKHEPKPETDRGEFTINLPEELLQVLAISPSKSALHREERLVRTLHLGTRLGTYDGNRGGHIFHVGETEGNEPDQSEEWGDAEESRQSEDDEWEEGEGVPWGGEI